MKTSIENALVGFLVVVMVICLITAVVFMLTPEPTLIKAHLMNPGVTYNIETVKVLDKKPNNQLVFASTASNIGGDVVTNYETITVTPEQYNKMQLQHTYAIKEKSVDDNYTFTIDEIQGEVVK
jgi:hypothetical protein